MGLLDKFKLGFFKEMNRKVAVKVTLLFGTMGAVYALLCWSILPLIFPDTQAIVFYVSGGIVQLVALPLIMVGSSILSEKAEIRAQQDHEMIMEQFEIAKHMREEADHQRSKVLEILTELEDMQVAADGQRIKLLEIADSELQEIVELKSLHEDLHILLATSKPKKTKK